VFQAECPFNLGHRLWIDVIGKDRAGRPSLVHHVERAPADAERAAIIARPFECISERAPTDADYDAVGVRGPRQFSPE
jgi:hypothetical protein